MHDSQETTYQLLDDPFFFKNHLHEDNHFRNRNVDMEDYNQYSPLREGSIGKIDLPDREDYYRNKHGESLRFY
jgi:hypothetical protein